MNASRIQTAAWRVAAGTWSRTTAAATRAVPALRGVDLDIAPGELTLLVGPSGCGKTTLISILAGTLDPTSGEVSVLGVDLDRLSKREKTAFRARTSASCSSSSTCCRR